MYDIPVYRVALIHDTNITTDQQPLCNQPSVVADVAHRHIGDADREHFIVLLVDARKRLIGTHTVAIGTLSAALIHPREVFKAAILKNAAALILAHNHPSGNAEPSLEDEQLTKLLTDAGTLLGIEVLDHVIIAHDQWYSLIGKEQERF